MSQRVGSRKWTDAQLSAAVEASGSWRAVLRHLGLASASAAAIATARRHAARLGLDTAHLDRTRRTSPELAKPEDEPQQSGPDVALLRRAGPAIAAAWFFLNGWQVSMPMEPTTYDLLVEMPDGIKRVQVKTTTFFNHGWLVIVGRRPYASGKAARRVPYDPESIDLFFIVDGDLNLYLIPSKAIAGRVGIVLHNYSEFCLTNIGSIMTSSNPVYTAPDGSPIPGERTEQPIASAV